jgi:peptidoglycan/xylan/chitin deacetylase (PgdA/CDA1 family)
MQFSAYPRALGGRLMAAHREPLVARLWATVLVLFILIGAGCGSGADPAERSKGGTAAERRKYATLPPVIAPVARTVRVPVLTYHRVHRYGTEREKSVPDLTVEPEVFASSMAALKRRGFRSVSNREVYDALFRGRLLPPKPVLITVDDGYRDAVTHVLPVLRRHAMVATFFVITGRLGGHEYLTQEDVRGLEAAGMDIGGHTSSHRDLTTLPQGELRRETAGSRRKLARILGHPVYFFAYPFGQYDDNVVAEVRRAGYSVAFTTESGTQLASTRPLTEPRIHVGRHDTPQQVVAYAEEAR